MREEIINLLKKAINGKVEISVTPPENPEFGHYSTNVAFSLAKDWKMSPMEAARDIESRINPPAGRAGNLESRIFEKIAVAAPGFINFWLKPEVFQKELEIILKNKDKYGRNADLKGQKTIVEYTDPNPFKEFHIGHLMSNAIGEAMARLFEWNGAEVKRACYQGDVGMHVAKAIWGIKKGLAAPYAAGAKAYESDNSAKLEINAINKKIYARSDKEINKIYDTGKKLSLEYFEAIYKKLGTKFDFYFFESEAGKYGKKIVEDRIKDGVFEKSEGAIVFRGENHGLHTRVFINSEGLPTYEAKELGLADIKHKKYAYDKSVVITGNEVNDYFKVVLAAMKIIFPKLAEKTLHLSHGMLRLPSGKMSSRTGEVITAESLIQEVEKLVAAKIRDREFQPEEEKKIEEIVAIGALKYSILKQAIGGDIIFDFEKSISFEGDSGPYLQYALTRAKSVLEKAENEKINPPHKFMWGIKPSLKTTPTEISEIEPMLCRFPEIIERAHKEFSPHYLSTYLTELARAFNGYYAKVKIVDVANKYSPYKLALTAAFAQIMKNGLEVLGIKAPEKM